MIYPNKKIKCLSFHAIKWILLKSNLNISLFELRAKNAKEYCVTCLLVILQKTNKLKIKKNNHLSIHRLYFFDIRQEFVIIMNVDPMIY
jgi:hypothetical protein